MCSDHPRFYWMFCLKKGCSEWNIHSLYHDLLELVAFIFHTCILVCMYCPCLYVNVHRFEPGFFQHVLCLLCKEYTNLAFSLCQWFVSNKWAKDVTALALLLSTSKVWWELSFCVCTCVLWVLHIVSFPLLTLKTRLLIGMFTYWHPFGPIHFAVCWHKSVPTDSNRNQNYFCENVPSAHVSDDL